MTDHRPTPKSRTLGAALREAREERGLKLRELARQLSLDPSNLSKWELGKQIPKDTVVAQILTHLGVNGERYEEIVGLTSNAAAGRWLAISLREQRQHLAAFLDLEQHADTIVTVSPLLIPGLLQVGGYVRAIMSAGELPADEISTRVAVRLGRRDAITRQSCPARLRAFVGEAALRQVIGSREVMVPQLQHLAQEAERDNVDLRVVPFGAGHHPGLEGPFTLFDLRADQGIGAIVHIENRRSGLFLQEDEDVVTYRHAVDMVAQVAMSLTDSIRLIATITEEMRTG